MAKQIDPLESERVTSSIRDVTHEFNPTTQNSPKESLEKSELEMRALKLEIRELRQSREDSTVDIEKLRRKSEKKKNELNIEKKHATTSQQLIEKLNREIESLTSQLNSTKEQENISKENLNQLEEMNEKMHRELEKYRKDKHTQNQEQEQINILQTSLSVQNRKLEEKNQKQETESKILKDQILLLSKQKQELRKRNEQEILQYKDEAVSRENENKQGKQKLENKIKALNEELEQQKGDYEDLRGEIKRLEKELEGKKNYFEEITVESTKDKDKMQDQYSKIEKEKQALQEQIGGLHTLINTIKENVSNLKFKLDNSEKEKAKMKTKNAELEKELAKTKDLEKMKKDIETSNIEELEKELKSERESSAILKKLIGRLNKEAENETVIKLKEELEQADKYKNGLEYKLEQMSQEIANRDSEIQQLNKNIKDMTKEEDLFTNVEIPMSDSKQKSEKNLFSIKSNKKEKSKVTVSKISADNPRGAEGGSPISTIYPIQNPTIKSPLKLKYRSGTINVLKLSALPSAKLHINKQVLCPIKKNLELGRLMAVFEVPTKIGKITKGAKYAGVLLNEAVGDSDGTFHGSQVFQCEQNHGWFTPLEDVYVPVI